MRLSHADGVPVRDQEGYDHAMLEAAARGDSVLHVSRLAEDVLSIGGMHPTPADTGHIWRRRTGGRAFAVGPKQIVVSLSLPHRSALVDSAPHALRPEQVMNRAVRGVLHALRTVGLDPTYPGLDSITSGGKPIGWLGFVERADGPTLFQACLGTSDGFARTLELSDRVDPEGRIAVGAPDLLGSSSVRAELPAGARIDDSVPEWTRLVSHGFSREFGVVLGTPGRLMPARIGADDLVGSGRPGVSPVHVVGGRLGSVGASVSWADGRVVRAAVEGDLLAREGFSERLSAAICGAASDEELRSRVSDFVDGQVDYVLGIGATEFAELLVSARVEGSPS